MGWKALKLFRSVGLIVMAVALLSGCGFFDSGSSSSSGGKKAGILDPDKIPKYAEPLVIPPVMPYVTNGPGFANYEISVKQFKQQVLPSGLPMTTVWGYGKDGDPLPGEDGATTYNYPAFTIETRTNETVQVKWINGLVDSSGKFLPHLLPVDRTLHWANPPGPCDMEPVFGSSSEVTPYKGPVPIITHVHGAHVPSISDGYPEAWYLPDATNVPSGYCTEGSLYNSVSPTDPGAAIFEYPNDQLATTLWYHDHTLGMTRLNVYAGLAGFWLIRDDAEDALGLPGPAPQLSDPPGTKYFEIPIVIQDRTFKTDGSLFYPSSRKYFDEYAGPYIPDTNVPPVWNPEFFGNTIVVNGRTWPYLEVEPTLYRFRFLNGSNSRFMILKFDREGMAFTQIGSDGGLLPDSPIELDSLTMAPAERADVLVDFSSFNDGDEIVLLNFGPDEPYKGPDPWFPQIAADPDTTGQVMKFIVTQPDGGSGGSVPGSLPAITPLVTGLDPRDLTLNEIVNVAEDIPIEAELGTGADGPLDWGQAITETPLVNSTEIWRIINLTEDAHPVHLHLVQFQVLDRTPFNAEAYAAAQAASPGVAPDITAFFTGPSQLPQSWELGWKDTVIANPGEVTRIIATYDMIGLYVWHCHILEHEDNEMMRPYEVISGP